MNYREVVTFLKESITEICGSLPDEYELHFADANHIDSHTLDWDASENVLRVVDDKSQIRVLIRVKDAKLAVARLGNNYFVAHPVGVHPTAIIESGACVGNECYIGPNAVIRSCVVLGDSCRIEAGAVIGNDGFGFVRSDGQESDWMRFPQLGRVILGDHVEIGAHSTIDRGALSDTVIDRDVKINANVHIAHNVNIGEHTVITANVNVSGSTIVGKNVWIGPGATIREHVSIGDNTIIGIASNVVRSVPPNQVWCGNPATLLKPLKGL